MSKNAGLAVTTNVGININRHVGIDMIPNMGLNMTPHVEDWAPWAHIAQTAQGPMSQG